jgi:hypothetical protein
MRGSLRAWQMKDSLAMRLARPARWKRDAPSLTRQRDRLHESVNRPRKAIDGPLERSAATPWPRHTKAESLGAQSHRLDEEYPVRTPGKIDKPLWTSTFGGPTETKKARSVVASSRVPRWAGFAGSPPAAGLPRTVNWPLVQIPADRHTTTGTCVLGEITICANRAPAQGFFGPEANNFARGASAGRGTT